MAILRGYGNWSCIGIFVLGVGVRAHPTTMNAVTGLQRTEDMMDEDVCIDCRLCHLLGGSSKRIRLRDKYATWSTIYTNWETCVIGKVTCGLLM